MKEILDVLDELALTGDLTLRLPAVQNEAANELLQKFNLVLDAQAHIRSRNETIVNHALDGIMTFKKETFAVEWMNPAALKMFGYETSVIKNFSVLKFLQPEVVGTEQQLASAFELLLAGAIEDNTACELIGLKQNGQEFPVELAINEVCIEHEELYIAMVRNFGQRQLTERARHESESKYRTLVNSMQDGVFIMQDGRLPFVNQAMADMLGYTLAEMADLPFSDIIDPEEFDMAMEYYERAAAKNHAPSNIEINLRAKADDTPIIVHMKTVVTQYKGQPAYMGTFTNISHHKHHENELRQAKEAAEAASRSKSAFLANMSHELRTPLNAIIGYSEMLEEDATDFGHDEFIPDLQKIQKAGRHLLELINDILDLSKIEAGKMDLFMETFSLSELLEDVAFTIGPLVEKKGNQLVLNDDDLGTMQADKTKVRQTLFNLLSNASKFTNDGTITIHTTRENMGSEGEWIQIQVIDTGIGIAPEKLEYLFEPFTQADASTTRKYGGTGLGLAISRRFCNMMGGDIIAESEVGKGSTFTVYLPAQPTKPSVQEIVMDEFDEGILFTGELSPQDKMGTVLVIDDDAIARDLIKRHLMREGFRVHTAVNGQEGLRMAAEIKPDAITLDVLLPSMDGWTVLSRLKEDPELANIPVIIVTMVEHKQMGYALGAADYLMKPIDKQTLVQVLERYRISAAPRFVGDHHVLIVEDDEPTRELMERTLEKVGWRVTAVENGLVALRALENAIPDLILLDLMMPEMDGFQFISNLRNNPEWNHIPTIVITAKELSVTEQMALNGNVQDVLQKGTFNRNKLLDQVSNLLGQYVRRGVLQEG
ncbi:MAG: response regulator [Chloroflexota bacterium]